MVEVVVADAVARHGGIPELIPKIGDMQEENEKRRIEREKQERSNDRSAKETTKMTLCGNPYTLYNNSTPRDSSRIYHKRQRQE